MEPCSIPEVSEDLSPEQAGRELEAIRVAATCNASHPYTNAHHPQHQQMKEAVTRLHEVYSTREGGDLSPMEQAMQKGLERQAVKNDRLRAEAQAEVEKLNELGYEGELPDDVQPHHLSALKMQRLAAQEDYEALTPMLEKELRSLRASGDILEAFNAFSRIQGMDETLKAEIAEQVIGYIHRANAHKYGGSKK